MLGQHQQRDPPPPLFLPFSLFLLLGAETVWPLFSVSQVPVSVWSHVRLILFYVGGKREGWGRI